jgi:hypothetical protein
LLLQGRLAVLAAAAAAQPWVAFLPLWLLLLLLVLLVVATMVRLWALPPVLLLVTPAAVQVRHHAAAGPPPVLPGLLLYCLGPLYCLLLRYRHRLRSPETGRHHLHSQPLLLVLHSLEQLVLLLLLLLAQMLDLPCHLLRTGPARLAVQHSGDPLTALHPSILPAVPAE